MEEIRGELAEQASALCGLAARGEQAEVRVSRLIRRKHRVTGEGVQSSGELADPVATVLRLAARGKDVYVTAGPATPEVLAAARELLPWGRAYREGSPLRPVMRELACPGGGLGTGALTRFRDRAAEAAARAQGGLRVLDCTVTETISAEAFADGQQPARSFACATTEASLQVEVRHGSGAVRLRAARHAASLEDIPLADLITEAGWRGAALLAPPLAIPPPADNSKRHRGLEGELLLSPAVSAAMLRVVTHEVLERRPWLEPGAALPCGLADDAHAAGSRHSRPFDHEGVPTGESVLLDRSGVPGDLACRGDAPGDGPAVLTGNALLAQVFTCAPEIRPTSVRLDGAAPYALPAGFTGSLGFATRGEGVQRFRSGDRIMFRVETAAVRDGAVTGRTPALLFAGTARDILASVRGAAPPLSYQPWPDYSTAAAWTLLCDPPASPC